MARNTDYQNSCPLFDYDTGGGGVLFPFYPARIDSSIAYIDLDGANTSTILQRCRIPFKARLITCQGYPVSDTQGLKAAAASTEPVIGITYGTGGLASAGAGTSIGVMTCSGSGGLGDLWTGTTTATDIATTQEVAIYLKTAASSGTSDNQDGGVIPVLWFAIQNAP